MRKPCVILLFLLCSGFVLPVQASVRYEVAESVIGDAGAFPMTRGFLEERLGKPDFTEEVPGFPGPLEGYVVEDGKEVSHIFLVYDTRDATDITYAMGIVMRGIDLATMVSILEEIAEGAQRVILKGANFALLEVAGKDAPQPLWALFEERLFQGEPGLVSMLIPPEHLLAYFVATYPDFQEPFRKALEERLQAK